MKIAFLVWRYEDDEHPSVVPEGHSDLDYCFKKVRIAYSEIIETE